MANKDKRSSSVKYISKRVCQEQFDCDGAKALFECLNCGTRQCENCEKLLHKPERQKFATHVRIRIEQHPCAVQCALCPYKPAEFSCLECKTLVCEDCNREYHRGKLTGHRRTPLPKQKQKEEEEVQRLLVVETSSPEDEMDPENCLPSSPFLDSLSEPTPCEIKERQTTILTGDISLSATGLNLIDELTLESDFHSLTASDNKGHLSSPDQCDIEREEFVSLDSNGQQSLEFLSGHFEGAEKASVAQSSVVAIPTSNVNKPAGMTVTHRTTRPKGKPGSEQISNQNKTAAECVGPGNPGLVPEEQHISHVKGNSDRARGHTSTGQLKAVQSEAEQQPTLKPKHAESSYHRPSSESEAAPQHSQYSLESSASSLGSTSSVGASGGKRRMEAIVKPVGSVTAVPSSPRGHDAGEMKRGDRGMGRHAEVEATPYQRGFLLVDESEVLQLKDAEYFAEKLGCCGKPPIKVISIFGNTGDGKSHTLNHTFFRGREVFHTSPTQDSCTIGVWAAYDYKTNIVVLDTEGLLGVSANENKRTRLLLKVIAISDVVIYRTRADRLHRDLFQFLGDASKAYLKHFTPELKLTLEKCEMKGPVSTLGPAVIVFHETRHTLPLGTMQPRSSSGRNKSADTLLQERFKEHGCNMDSFSCVQYIGVQTIEPPTEFTTLKTAILSHVNNTSVRSPRSPEVVFLALKGLNDKFSGAIESAVPTPFPDEYFTCSHRCLSCDSRCTNTMNHSQENVPHAAPSRCQYQHQFDNRVYICKACYQGGREVVVVPKMCSATDGSWVGMFKYAVSGFVLECPHCGVIYRSRQYWYGNQEPEMDAVRTEIRHVWPGGSTVLQGTHNAGRRLLDGIHHVVDAVSSVSAKPTKIMSQWMMDQIAPPYWRPNAEIEACLKCKLKFDGSEKIHHCRVCGEGFCDECSQRQLPVPERGWGPKPVRVCNECFHQKTQDVGGGIMPSDIEAELASAMDSEPQLVTARKVGEVLQTTLGVLGTAVNYPAGMLIEAARPAYWIRDSAITHCIVCEQEFNPKLKIHHCRGCGQGVCEECSANRRPVPSRGWDIPVRVCAKCNVKEGQL